MRRLLDALAQRFQPQARLKRFDVTQYCHHAPLLEREHRLAALPHPVAKPGQHAHLDLAPGDSTARLPVMGPNRDLHPIGPPHEGQEGNLRCERFGDRPLSSGQPSELFVQPPGHRLPPACLHPVPNATRTDLDPGEAGQ